MDFTMLKHTHYLFTIGFLLSYLVKTVLFFNNREAFLNYKKKTLLPETLFAVGFLITGLMMLFQMGGFGAMQVWFHLKFTLVLAAIPIGIIGFKKENKAMVIISALFFVYVLLMALTKSPTLIF